jgi:hypothetical protein
MAELSSEKQVPFAESDAGNKVLSSSDSGEEGIVDTSGINEKSLLRKLDLKLLPPLSLLYLLSFLDRSNGTLNAFPSFSQNNESEETVADFVGSFQLRMLGLRAWLLIWA